MKKITWNFESSSKREWLEAAKSELKGKEPEQLIFTDPSGLIHQPYYDWADRQSITGNHFTNFEPFGTNIFNYYTAPVRKNYPGNEDLMNGLNLGAQSVSLELASCDPEDLEKALNKVVTDIINWEFDCGNKADKFASWLMEEKLPISSLCLKQLPSRKLLPVFLEWSDKNETAFPITIGIPSTQEIVNDNASALAQLIDLVDELIQSGLSPDKILKKLRFSFELGLDFFSDAAKIRAFQKVLDAILGSYGLKSPSRVLIHGVATPWNQEAMGPHESMLKSTTNVTAALIAGCNSIQVVPADPTNEMQRRVAWHTLNVLSEEAHLDKVSDPGRGSYYFEDLTWQIAEKTLGQLKKIEANGGYKKI